MTANQSWKDRAACRTGWDPEMWFPEAFEANSSRTLQAKKICGLCSVTDECYEYGKNEPTGIWGGVMKTRARPGRSQAVRSAS